MKQKWKQRVSQRQRRGCGGGQEQGTPWWQRIAPGRHEAWRRWLINTNCFPRRVWICTRGKIHSIVFCTLSLYFATVTSSWI